MDLGEATQDQRGDHVAIDLLRDEGEAAHQDR